MSPAVVRLPRNEHGRDIICGDVHGHFAKLTQSLAAIGFQPGRDRLILCGDLVDRGPDSEEALDWLRRPWVHAVLGNHEQMAMLYVGDESIAPMYAANGGGWFMRLQTDRQVEMAREFDRLPLAIELETEQGLVVVAHADLPAPTWEESVALLTGDGGEDAMTGAVSQMLWGRLRISVEDCSEVPDVRAVVHGHTPVDRHTTLGNVHFIDGGAWLQRHSRRQFILLDAATLQPIKFEPVVVLQ